MFLDRNVTFILLIVSYVSHGYNLNPKSSQIIQAHVENSSSFFGFSVAFQKRDRSSATREEYKPWLVVGAPRSSISYLNSEETGDVFKCNTDNEGRCVSIMAKSMFLENYKDHWSNAWIGAVVRTYSYDTRNNVILMCGPRYATHLKRNDYDFSLDGICFYRDEGNRYSGNQFFKGDEDGFGLSADFEELLTTVQSTFLSTNDGPSCSELAICSVFSQVQTGWSAMIGSYSFKNTALDSSKAEKGTVWKLIKGMPDTHPQTVSKVSAVPGREMSTFFGYSVTTAGKNSARVIYVSSPRFANTGKVEIFETSDYGYRQKGSVIGEQIGEFFGASLCVVQSHDNGIEYIVVGAPFFASREDSFDEGRIGIISNTQYRFKKPVKYRYGKQKTGAQFGLSLSAIGDINGDGLTDIVVGAPYEDGRGAIYIFLGDEDYGLAEDYSQHIRASEIDQSLLGFGISMTGEQDIDFNNFDDIGIGSYLSSKVVLLKSRPIITLGGNLNILSEFEGSLPSDSDKLHLISACVYYKEKEGVIESDIAYVKIHIDVDPFLKRTKSIQTNSTLATLKGSSIETVSVGIAYGRSFCLNITFQLQEEIRNMDEELLIEMKHSIVDDERCEKECPMTDPKSGDVTELKLIFKIYDTDLQISSKFINITGSTYMYTSENRNLLVEVKFLNKKEKAIATKLCIEMSSMLSVTHVEGDERCKSLTRGKTVDGKTNYSCNFRNVKRGEEPTILIELSTSNLTETVDELFFNFNVTSKSRESEDDLHDNFSYLKLSVLVDAPLRISGIANPQEIRISNYEKNEKDNKFEHDYEVSNRSPMKLTVGINITVPIPVIVSDVERVPMILLVGKLRLPNDDFLISCSNDADEDLKRYFLEWNEIPDQNFTRGLSEKLTSKAKNIMKKNFDCNYQSQFTSETSIALACVNVSCSSLPFEGNATVEVRMRSSYKVFDYLIGNDGMRKFITKASVFLPHSQARFNLSGNREATVETPITVSFHKIPILPLVLAVVITLVLLIIITYGLYKANFFKRNRVNKEIPTDAGADAVNTEVDAATSIDNLLT